MRALLGATVAVLCVAGCGGDDDGSTPDATTARCGDMLCESSERTTCPADCASRVDGGGGTVCIWRGSEHAPGTTFPAGDGCNTCDCSETGSVSCTESVCMTTEGCRSDVDCEPSEYCAAPGSGGGACGIPCPLAPCTTSTECMSSGSSDVCHRGGFETLHSCCRASSIPTGTGLCAPPCASAMDCGDGMRCAADGACEPIPCSEGFACVDGTRCETPASAGADVHGCAPIGCTEGFTCPAQTACVTGDPSADAHGCVRGTCDMDSECTTGGYCVESFCYPELGRCLMPSA